ncbi:MAG: CHASE3 domain-containing protein [Saprospiraceae bacterium]
MRNETLKYLYWVLAGTVLVLFLVGLAAFRNLEQAQGYGELVNHTTNVLLQAEATVSLIKDAETGVRGYIITHDSKFLQPYSQSITSVFTAIRVLDSMTIDNERQRNPVRVLDSLTFRRFRIMKQTMSISVSTYDRDTLREKMLQGRLVMDSIRAVTKKIQQEEKRLLRERQQKADEFSKLTPFWLGLISLLAVALFSASSFMVILELRRRWRYESQLEQAVEDLKKTNAELENFVYLTTHHFQEPLRKLQTFSGRLMSKYQSTLHEEAVFMLQRISDSAARMQQLMDDLLLYLRFDGLVKKSEFQAVDLSALLNSVLTEQTGKLDAEHRPDLQVETDHSPAVLGDETQLKILFEQLLDNSLKFARQNVRSVIKIRTFVTNGTEVTGVSMEQSDHKFCAIEFSDNGIGFDMAFTEKIFQLFQRLHHRHEYPGTGIGLAISKKIVANHRGYLAVESRINEGTVFFVYLPLAAASDPKL